MGLGSFIVKKGIWYLLSIGAVLSIGAAFNILPQSLKDFLAWFSANTTSLLIALCFLIGCWTVIKVTGHKKQGES